MQAVILASKKSETINSAGFAIPKAMIPLAGKPYLEHVLENLPEYSEEVVLVVGYRGDMIKQHFGDYFCGRELRYVWQFQTDDTDGAMRRAAKILHAENLSVFDIDEIEI